MNCLTVSKDVIVVAKGSYIDCYFNNKEHKILRIEDASTGTDNFICDLATSHDNQYLSILTSSKKIFVHKLPALELVKSFSLPRSASKIRFGVESNNIFVADKTGDVLLYSIDNDEGGVKLLGHLSLLLNVLQSEDGNFLISSDRDEKIRVSCYPNTYNIQTYCLGHKEFVNHVEFLPHNPKYLLSGSGDGTIKCWDYIIGHNCCTIETKLDISDQSVQEEFKKIMDEEGIEVDNLPIVHFSTSKLNNTTSIIAVSVHLCKMLLIYTLETNDCKFQHNLVHTVELQRYPLCIQLFEKYLYVLDSYDDNVIQYEIKTINDSVTINKIQTVKMFGDQETATVVRPDNEHIKVLYKRKFDNVQEYQERKKNRLIKST